jgi:hypothetical protein
MEANDDRGLLKDDGRLAHHPSLLLIVPVQGAFPWPMNPKRSTRSW